MLEGIFLRIRLGDSERSSLKDSLSNWHFFQRMLEGIFQRIRLGGSESTSNCSSRWSVGLGKIRISQVRAQKHKELDQKYERNITRQIDSKQNKSTQIKPNLNYKCAPGHRCKRTHGELLACLSEVAEEGMIKKIGTFSWEKLLRCMDWTNMERAFGNTKRASVSGANITALIEWEFASNRWNSRVI